MSCSSLLQFKPSQSFAEGLLLQFRVESGCFLIVLDHVATGSSAEGSKELSVPLSISSCHSLACKSLKGTPGVNLHSASCKCQSSEKIFLSNLYLCTCLNLQYMEESETALAGPAHPTQDSGTSACSPAADISMETTELAFRVEGV